MPAADASFRWEQAALGFAAVTVLAFLVSWVSTDLLRLSRTVYIAILTVAAAGLGALYLGWSETPADDLVTGRWGWGVLTGMVAAALVAPLVRRLPSGPRARGGRLGYLLVWEAGVYGIGEALLLAALPVLTAWQAMASLGWTDTGWGKALAGGVAITGALVVIVVHHLGYEEFRRPAARKKLAGALLSCGLQGVAFLVTGSILAPVVAHVVLHAQMVVQGVELPPVEEPVGPIVTGTAVPRPVHVG
jgi:hypothetical protein